MKRIGILSDTHSHWDERFARHFANCDCIFHCGDIGSLAVTDQLKEIAPLYAVYGNIDTIEVREEFPEICRVTIEQVPILMTHIGGYPTRYKSGIRSLLKELRPKLFLCGHSHILKVMPDPELDLLHINPGAAGLHGWQTVRTLVRLDIDGAQMKNLEVIELSY